MPCPHPELVREKVERAARDAEPLRRLADVARLRRERALDGALAYLVDELLELGQVLGDHAVVEVEQLDGDGASISVTVELGANLRPEAVALFTASMREILAPYPGATLEIVESAA